MIGRWCIMNTKIGMDGWFDFHLRRLKPTESRYPSNVYITSSNCIFTSFQWISLKIGLKWKGNEALCNQHNFWSRNTIGTLFIFTLKNRKIKIFVQNWSFSPISNRFQTTWKPLPTLLLCFRQVWKHFELWQHFKDIPILWVSTVWEFFQYGHPSIPILVFMEVETDRGHVYPGLAPRLKCLSS